MPWCRLIAGLLVLASVAAVEAAPRCGPGLQRGAQGRAEGACRPNRALPDGARRPYLYHHAYRGPRQVRPDARAAPAARRRRVPLWHGGGWNWRRR